MDGDRYPRLSIRADHALLERLDRLAAALCEVGVNVRRSGAARAAGSPSSSRKTGHRPEGEGEAGPHGAPSTLTGLESAP